MNCMAAFYSECHAPDKSAGFGVLWTKAEQAVRPPLVIRVGFDHLWIVEPWNKRWPGQPRASTMKVGDRHFRTIWLNDDGQAVDIIDQRWLPHEFRVETLSSVEDIATAIRDMWVRGAPLIGVTAAYGMALQMRDDPSDDALDAAWATLNRTRPTAINLRWALDEMRTLCGPCRPRID
jgi:hypothetical protein